MKSTYYLGLSALQVYTLPYTLPTESNQMFLLTLRIAYNFSLNLAHITAVNA